MWVVWIRIVRQMQPLIGPWVAGRGNEGMGVFGLTQNTDTGRQGTEGEGTQGGGAGQQGWGTRRDKAGLDRTGPQGGRPDVDTPKRHPDGSAREGSETRVRSL